MSGDGETSDLAAVESMLRAARGGDRTGSVRAITLNLVVVAPDAADDLLARDGRRWRRP